ncbi:hypothetical protein [Kamptonema formosum]|nr:hypothetical protein [Oscillatoria sp. PCC 10802]
MPKQLNADKGVAIGLPVLNPTRQVFYGGRCRLKFGPHIIERGKV